MIVSEKTIREKGFLERIGGAYYYTPKGKEIKNRIENTVRASLNAAGGCEIEFPIIVDYSLMSMDELIKRGRKAQCVEVRLGPGGKSHIVRTCEEMAAEYFFANDASAGSGLVYQIKIKVRDEDPCLLNIVKRVEFTMLDAYGIETDPDDPHRLYDSVRGCFCDIFDSFGIRFECVRSREGSDQGIESEEFVYAGAGALHNLEIAHIYKLGNVYSKPFGKNTDMDSFGIGIDRLFTLVCLLNY